MRPRHNSRYFIFLTAISGRRSNSRLLITIFWKACGDGSSLSPTALYPLLIFNKSSSARSLT